MIKSNLILKSDYYCCIKMKSYANNIDCANEGLIDYSKKFRCFGFILNGNPYGTYKEFMYCPWCGVRFPSDLSEIWGSILRKEYNIESPGMREDEEIPVEFRDDSWWIKRDMPYFLPGDEAPPKHTKEGVEVDFCCGGMDDAVYNVSEAEYPILEYDKRYRTYDFILVGNPNRSREEVLYCPWCDKKLEKRLDIIWRDILKKEYGLEEPLGEDKDKVPEEFRSDAWWRKRGL